MWKTLLGVTPVISPIPLDWEPKKPHNIGIMGYGIVWNIEMNNHT